jgi:GR25 family glycosyltransferase involved in LPS biosynthesis
MEAQLQRCDAVRGLLGGDASRVRWVDAYDGARVSPAALRRSRLVTPEGLERLALPERSRTWGMDLSAGGVGCALSHADVWCSILENVAAADLGALTSAGGDAAALELAVHELLARPALVLEDDTQLPDDFPALLRRRLAAVPDDYQLVFASGLDTEGAAPRLQVAPGVCRVPRLYRTTNCYVLRPQGAASLLQLCLPMTVQLDTAMTTLLCGGPAVPGSGPRASGLSDYVTALPAYCLHPPIAAQLTRLGSDIQWEHPQEAARDLAAEERGRLTAAGLSQ